jgi:hypothetical protein
VGAAFWLIVIQNVILLATVIAVFWQLRQVKHATRRDAVMRAVEDQDRLNELLLEYPQLKRFFDPHGDYVAWKAEEIDFATFFNLALGRFERLYMFQREGLVDKALWDSWTKWVKEFWLAIPLSRKTWNLEGKFYSKPFQEFINEMIEESRYDTAA